MTNLNNRHCVNERYKIYENIFYKLEGENDIEFILYSEKMSYKNKRAV